MLKEGNMHPTDKMTLYQNDVIKTLKIIVNASAEYI